MKPSSAKAKGRKHQQWVRDKLLERFPDLEPDDIRSTGMGQGGEDLQLSPAARKVIPYSFECKSLAKFAGYSHIKQAQSNCPDNAQPLVVIKANKEEPIVLIDAVHFFDLLRRLYG